jgi:hypothetical protein
MARMLLISGLVIAVAGCSAAATTPSAATPTGSAVAVATVPQSPAPERTPTPSASLVPLTTPESTAGRTPQPTLKATPIPGLVGCPTPPVTVDEIAGLTPERALACFGGAPLTFEAYVPAHPYGVDEASDSSLSPTWLDGLGGSVVALSAGPDAGALVRAYVPPALGRCDWRKSIAECPFGTFEGGRVLVRAHFDDPVATTCRAVSVVEGSTFTDAEAVTVCRRLLIVSSVGRDVPSAPAASGG